MAPTCFGCYMAILIEALGTEYNSDKFFNYTHQHVHIYICVCVCVYIYIYIYMGWVAQSV